jgi:hypothetical protein
MDISVYMSGPANAPSSPPLLMVSLTVVSVTFGQLWPKNIKWVIPEIMHEF